LTQFRITCDKYCIVFYSNFGSDFNGSKEVKHSLYAPWRRLGEKSYSSYSFTASALDGVSCQRHAPTALYHRGRTPCTHLTGGWVGPRAGLDSEVKGKILCLCRGSSLDRPVNQSVARHYTDWATPAPRLSWILIVFEIITLSVSGWSLDGRLSTLTTPRKPLELTQSFIHWVPIVRRQ
jgi:hypothetical protein